MTEAKNRTMQGKPSTILNAMTVDVEEHFQVSNFDGIVDRQTWASMQSRVEDNTERLLDLFDETGVRATFFVLGWVAEQRPGLVRRIADRGHEIASHGYSHRLVYSQDPSEFQNETALSRQLLQDASGQPVHGYRAASFSITKDSPWALDILVETGFTYDSSLFPVRHPRYGVPGAAREIHLLRTPGGGTLIEVPPSTLAFGKVVLPVAGGGYLRLYPTAMTRFAIDYLNRREGAPAVVYVHPWEVDPDQPRFRTSWVTRIRHYHGLSQTARKLTTLMAHHRFATVSEVIAAERTRQPTPLEAAGDAWCPDST
jgi:polysaccharide deacetylase family protein (PEP-CTERM system associated)